jgi:HSP20 family protein
MLMRLEPFRELDRITEQMLAEARGRQVPVAYRRGNEFKVDLDLPGADPGSIDLTVEREAVNFHDRNGR